MIPAPEHPEPLVRLRLLVAALRGPGGCPWDREQTHASLRPHLLEEAYEVIDAIQRQDDSNLREELGDFLLQVLLHAQIAEEEGRFDIDDIAHVLCEKLVRRHPHVFGDEGADNSTAVVQRWEQIKQAEKGVPSASALDGITAGLPALMRAEKMQKKAARVGFDWPDAAGALAKLREEIGEVDAAVVAKDAAEIEDELGDLLFSVVNVARKLKCDPEVALTRATDKFATRFQQVESIVKAEGRELAACTLAELDAIWDRIKTGQKPLDAAAVNA